MTIGISAWGDRVSPVLDEAERLLVFGDGATSAERTVLLAGLPPWKRAQTIRDSGVDVLVCGAVTRPLLEALGSAGVLVHPWVTGDVSDVLAAARLGELQEGRFAMPGCGRGRRAGRGRGCGGPRRGRKRGANRRRG